MKNKNVWFDFKNCSDWKVYVYKDCYRNMHDFLNKLIFCFLIRMSNVQRGYRG